MNNEKAIELIDRYINKKCDNPSVDIAWIKLRDGILKTIPPVIKIVNPCMHEFEYKGFGYTECKFCGAAFVPEKVG